MGNENELDEGHLVQVTYKIKKDGSGVGVFLNDLPILLLPTEHFHEFAKLTAQADNELRQFENQPFGSVNDFALGFNPN